MKSKMLIGTSNTLAAKYLVLSHVGNVCRRTFFCLQWMFDMCCAVERTGGENQPRISAQSSTEQHREQSDAARAESNSAESPSEIRWKHLCNTCACCKMPEDILQYLRSRNRTGNQGATENRLDGQSAVCPGGCRKIRMVRPTGAVQSEGC